jgi:hypothetical protein
MARPRVERPEPAEPRDVSPLTPEEVATIAPLSRDGAPDLYNFIPTRLIPLDEAQARGWPLFFDGRICRYNHTAPRYVVNPKICVDCRRIKNGKAPIGGRAGGPSEYKPQPYKQRDLKTPDGTVVAIRAPEPDRLEKLFLEKYAAVKNLEEAAVLAGTSVAQIHARLSISQVFKAATNDLETRLGIRPTVPDAGEFSWDDDKRVRFITVYIDTGDIATARDAIRVTPSEYYREIDRNHEFSARVADAEPLAMNALEERAIQLALGGNDKLLLKTLAAKKPDQYRERLGVDLNVTNKLTDAQIDARLAQLIAVERGPAIDVECHEPVRQIETAGTSGREAATSEPEQTSDLL